MIRNSKDTTRVVRKLMDIAAQSIGLPDTAGIILTTLYTHRATSEKGLSIGEMSDDTGLSRSTVSQICSQLGTAGILTRRADTDHTGRGRRKMLYYPRVSLHHFLSLSIRRYVQDINRIRMKIEAVLSSEDQIESIENSILKLAKVEIEMFLSDFSQFSDGGVNFNRPVQDHTSPDTQEGTAMDMS
ncbi:MAG: helix-turn-helix domain-containing protein [Candidatus Lokiarchaeota archaeon]|nr:helix-turn-helix domain-containing protein [Candidatus Lokiarchaeota archaeon]